MGKIAKKLTKAAVAVAAAPPSIKFEEIAYLLSSIKAGRRHSSSPSFTELPKYPYASGGSLYAVHVYVLIDERVVKQQQMSSKYSPSTFRVLYASSTKRKYVAFYYNPLE